MAHKRVAKSGKSESGRRLVNSTSGAGDALQSGKAKKAPASKTAQAHSILLIAGMHRSGTSALTRILNLRGISLPGELLGPAIDNPTGFWESKRIIAFHNSLFEAFGAHFEDILALPEDWLKSASAQAAIEELRNIISEEYATHPISVVKDPRICRVLPVWYAALETLDIQPKTIIPVRYPLDVAGSLQTRNQLSLVHGLLAWLDHVTWAEFDSRGKVRSIATFEALMSDWRKTTDKISSDLGIVFPRAIKQSSADVARFLSAELVHHAGNAADADPRITTMALDAWTSLGRLAVDQSDAAAQAKLDAIRSELAGMARPLADIANTLERKAREAIALVISSDKVRREWYEPEIARLQKALEEQDRVKRTWFEPEIERRDADIATLKSEIDRLVEVIAKHERAKKDWFEPEIERRDAQITSLKAELTHRDSQAAESRAEVARMTEQAREEAQAKQDWFASVVAEHGKNATKLNAELDRLTQLATEYQRGQEAALGRMIETLANQKMETDRGLRSENERLRSELAETQAQLANAHQNVASLALAAQASTPEIRDARRPWLFWRSTTEGGMRPDGEAVLRRVARYAKRRLRGLATGSSDRQLVESSGLFDENWYRRNARELGGHDALKHYLTFGARHETSPSPGFDAAWYLSTNPDVRAAGINPLVHYLRFGILEGRQPVLNPPSLAKPNSSSSHGVDLPREAARKMLIDSRLFDADWYRKNNPDIRGMDPWDHYLDKGGREGRWPSPYFNAGKYAAFNPDVMAAGHNPLVHYLLSGRNEGRQAGMSMPVLSIIKSTIEELRDIEPQIAGEAAFVHPDWLHAYESYRPLPLNVAWNKIFSSLQRPYDYIIFIPWFVRGGAEQEAAYAARQVIDKLGPNSVLVVATTNERREGIDWFPDTADKLIFSEIDPTLTHDDRVRLVEMLIYAIRPKSVLNVNSHALWDAIMRRGVALSNMSDLYALIFCKDYGPDGRPGGYLDTHFRACLRHLRRVYTDNETIIDQLAEEFSLTAAMRDKLAFVPQPIDANTTRRNYVTSRGKGRMPVIWSGRLARQKHIDMLVAVVERSPDIQFDVYGSGEAQYQEMLEALASKVDNVTLKGAFTSFDALPIENYAAYLFTSLWEGMPNTIISAAASGIPIVAADAGGIRELINSETGWLVEPNDLEAHVEALDEIRRNPSEAARRVSNLVKLVNKRHSWGNYAKTFSNTPSFLD